MSPTLPCRYFALGSCSKGSQCPYLHEKNKSTVCQFYLKGNCSFGSRCALEHSKPKKSMKPVTEAVVQSVPKPVSVHVSVSKPVIKRDPLCPFSVQGTCKYGTKCKYLHGLPCPKCGKHCLDPRDDPSIHQEHIQACRVLSSELKECVVCLETVQEKADNRFGLLG